ncbi:hypothetical protein [Bacteroides acidifaciens]|uniref:hypothetical protein n=1 Tax=Bacteroides acidifaciens TaxID=85831 RepID=UPI00263A871E|nr:hypothetical protein [Bacteroides acidifaciens]
MTLTKIELLERKEELINGFDSMLHKAADLYNNSVSRYNRIVEMINASDADDEATEKLYQMAKAEEQRMQRISDHIFGIRKTLMEICASQIVSDEEYAALS